MPFVTIRDDSLWASHIEGGAGLQKRIHSLSAGELIELEVDGVVGTWEKTRVGTLRLVLSELQKDAKEGKGDELAVMRRERKRRQESARAFRDGGRDDLAEAEDAEAVMIEAYLPAELGDDELERIVADAVAQTGAESPRDMGKVMPVAMAQVAGRADGKRVSEKVKEALQGA